MDPITPFECAGATLVTFAKDQPGVRPLPALLFDDEKILTEWTFTEDERARIARGENLRLWVWLGRLLCTHCGLHEQAHLLQPLCPEITDERIA